MHIILLLFWLRLLVLLVLFQGSTTYHHSIALPALATQPFIELELSEVVEVDSQVATPFSLALFLFYAAVRGELQ